MKKNVDSHKIIKAIFLLPYIRTIDGVQIGRYIFKALEDIKKEPQEVQSELGRIASFFREREMRALSAFNYLIIENTQEELDTIFLELKRSLEIFRYLTVDPEGKGMDAEHTTIYIVFPDSANPRKFKESGEHFMYKVNENFSGKDRFVTFPHSSSRPLFYKDVYGSDPPYIEPKLMQILENKLSETDLRAVAWYNKTFSTTAQDDKENLLRLSVAYESHFSLSEEEGKKEALSEISKVVSPQIKDESVLPEMLRQIKMYTASRIVKRLADAVKNVTGSEPIQKWFKKHFYSVGSGIRHGSDVAELPRPVVSKSKLGKSLYYAGDASHEYLNNVYFGRRLFKFLVEERYFPYEKYLKKLEVENLEKLLVSDEERLKILESTLANKAVGSLTPEDVHIAFSFNQSYYGSKERILEILKRLLEELKTMPIWSEIAIHAETVLAAKLKEADFEDYEGIKPFYHALIEVDSILHDKFWMSPLGDKDSMQTFYIRHFISYAVHRVL